MSSSPAGNPDHMQMWSGFFMLGPPSALDVPAHSMPRPQTSRPYRHERHDPAPVARPKCQDLADSESDRASLAVAACGEGGFAAWYLDWSG
jgi:hypothetical protein